MYIKLAFSPCPNDTFIFDALVHGKIDTEGLGFDYRMEDVESLNRLAMSGKIDMVKISYHAWLYLAEKYVLLNSGSALGFGSGPLLISKKEMTPSEINGSLIAIPGEFTTAHLLFRIAYPDAKNKRFMIFSEIEDAILSGRADAGVIIHENRFTYESKGLKKLNDLGEYWETLTHSPIPLGGIVARSSLHDETIAKLQRIMHRSVTWALEHPSDTMSFVRCNAREMDEEVMKKHIALYVNEFSVDLGTTGKQAVARLMEVARDRKLV
ncbi:MAG: 1,4-dihydroxy-6-naphthoate synthase [bacterium]